MSILSFFKRKKETSLLVDVGNGSVTCAIVLFVKNSKPKFIHSMTRHFTATERPDPLRLSEGVLALLEYLLSNIVKKSGKLSSVLVSFSAPWFVLKTKNIHLENDATFVITKSFLADVLSKEENSLQNGFDINEKSIIHATVNGYQIENIIGKKTKVMDASVFMSATAKDVQQKVTGAISKQTHIDKNKIVLHSFPLVMFSVVRDNFEKSQDFILMDITSEITDITLVVGNTIVKNTSFPFGRNSIVRQISKTLNLSTEIAQSELNMYMTGKLDDSGVSIVQAILTDLEKEWSIYLEDSLLSLSPDLILPSSLYITADEDSTPIFMEFLQLSKTDVTGNFRKNINITYINKEVLAPLYQTSSKVGEDEFIAMLAIFYDKLFKNQ